MAIENESVPNEKLSAEDIFNELGKEDEAVDKDDLDTLSDKENKEEDEPEEELEDKEEDESDEETEDEDEESEEEPDLTEEDEIDSELADIPRRADIKKEFPDFFKKFPALDHIMQREKQYSQIFHTVGDAKQAKERLDTFKVIEGELFSGDLASILKTVKDSDEGSYDKIVGNYLGSLYKVDKTAHLELTNNIFKGVVKHIFDQVKDETDSDTPNGQLKLAAKLIYKSLYGTNEVKGPEIKEAVKTDNTEENRLKNERMQFENDRLQTAATDVISRAERVITKYVSQQVDPKGILPEYVKGKLIADVIDSLDKTMKRDDRYKSIIDRLYIESKSNNYSDDSKKRIINTILKKAKSILPGAIKAKKAEAMKGLNFRKKESLNDEDSQISRGKREPSEKREKLTSNRRDDDRNKMRPGETAKQFMMRD